MRAFDAIKKQTGHPIGYNEVQELVWNLMLKGAICESDPFGWWSSSRSNYNDSYPRLSDLSFKAGRRKRRTLDCNDIPDLIGEAFKYGKTLPLYDLFDYKARLCAVGNKTTIVRGRKAIIESIENEMNTLIYHDEGSIDYTPAYISDESTDKTRKVHVILEYTEKDGERHEYAVIVFIAKDKIKDLMIFEIKE